MLTKYVFEATWLIVALELIYHPQNSICIEKNLEKARYLCKNVENLVTQYISAPDREALVL